MNNKSFALALLFIVPALSSAQSAPAWDADVRAFDAAYWDAYNRCDVEKLSRMNTASLEFYHDEGGPMIGNEQFVAAMKKNICGNDKVKIRRAEIAGTVQVFPMRDKNALYGAVIQGEHQFFNTVTGQSEQMTGRARFTHLLLLEGGAWKVARVFSFDHGAAAPGQERKEIALTAAQLDRHIGEYTGAGHPAFAVQRVDNHITLTTEGKTFALAASGPDTFFLRSRDITATFSHRDGAKSTVTIREMGKVVAEGTRTK
jgi:hypothetical protein